MSVYTLFAYNNACIYAYKLYHNCFDAIYNVSRYIYR